VPPEADPDDVEEEGTFECPAYCLGGCIAGACLIPCIGDCKNETFECAPQMSCELVCAGERSCQGVQLHCAAGSSCSITCTGRESCKGLELSCTTAECAVGCGMVGACQGLKAACDAGSTCHTERCDDNSLLTCGATSTCSSTDACLLSTDVEDG
jgi:hypothetical protein